MDLYAALLLPRAEWVCSVIVCEGAATGWHMRDGERDRCDDVVRRDAVRRPGPSWYPGARRPGPAADLRIGPRRYGGYRAVLDAGRRFGLLAGGRTAVHIRTG